MVEEAQTTISILNRSSTLQVIPFLLNIIKQVIYL